MGNHNCEEGKYVSRYLTHFVGRGETDDRAFEIPCKVLRERELLPHGREGNREGNVRIAREEPFSSNELLWPEIVCLCDIPLNDTMLRRHTRNYSRFGLAFDKTWLAQEQGANPVLYLAQGSVLTDHRFIGNHPLRVRTREDFFDLAAGDWLNDLERRGPDARSWPRSDNLVFWYLLCYCKFFDENLGQDDRENYYMEREWRTIGKVAFGLTDIAKIVLSTEFIQEFRRQFGKLIPDLEDKIVTLDKGESNPGENR